MDDSQSTPKMTGHSIGSLGELPPDDQVPGKIVRKATEADLEGIARVFIASRTQCLPFLNWDYSQEVMVSVFRRKMASETHCVAEQDDEIVGFISFTGDEVGNLYVAPDLLDHGIGTALLEVALAQANPEIRLCVFQENLRARRFYEQHGFEVEFETDGKDNMERTPDARYVRRQE